MNKKIVKEAIIIILLLIVIVFAMGILFYDSITENADVIADADYETSETVNDVLKEIEENSGENNIKESTSNSLLKSYSINAEDLSNYASGNYYESGKKDPFAESAETIDEHTTTTVQTGTTTKSQTSNPVENNEKNTVSNTVTNTTSAAVTNQVQSTTNTIKNVSIDTNTVNSNKINTVSNTAKDKAENTSNKGTFFENKNSK